MMHVSASGMKEGVVQLGGIGESVGLYRSRRALSHT